MVTAVLYKVKILIAHLLSSVDWDRETPSLSCGDWNEQAHGILHVPILLIFFHYYNKGILVESSSCLLVE